MPRYRNPYPGASPYKDRHGKVRWRYRTKGRRDVPLPAGGPGAPDFRDAYAAAVACEPVVAAGRSAPGTFDRLIAEYYASGGYTQMKTSTRATYRGIIERFRIQHGAKRVAHLRPRDVFAMQDKVMSTPAAANNLVRMIRTLMDFAIKREWPGVASNPARGVEPLRTNKGDFHTWTEDELARFRAKHGVGSRARLAFELMLGLGQRGRSDVTRLGRQHVQSGRIVFTQQKTGTELSIKIEGDLQATIGAMPRTNLTFLVTAYGKPFTPAGFGNWFGDMVREAGLPQRCVAHGLRKAAARQLAEAGASTREIMAVTGHQTSKEVDRYTKAASQHHLSDSAQSKRAGAKKEQTLANPNDRFASMDRISLKTQES